MSEQRGNPKVLVRLEPDALADAQAAFPAVRGTSGGVALALRRLLYLALDRPMPRQWGETERPEGPEDLEERVRLMEASEGLKKSRWAKTKDEAKAMLSQAQDRIDVLRLRAVLGRLLVIAPSAGSAPRRPTGTEDLAAMAVRVEDTATWESLDTVRALFMDLAALASDDANHDRQQEARRILGHLAALMGARGMLTILDPLAKKTADRKKNNPYARGG